MEKNNQLADVASRDFEIQDQSPPSPSQSSHLRPRSSHSYEQDCSSIGTTLGNTASITHTPPSNRGKSYFLYPTKDEIQRKEDHNTTRNQEEEGKDTMSRGGRGGSRGGILKGTGWDNDLTLKLDSKPSELFPVCLFSSQVQNVQHFPWLCCVYTGCLIVGLAMHRIFLITAGSRNSLFGSSNRAGKASSRLLYWLSITNPSRTILHEASEEKPG